MFPSKTLTNQYMKYLLFKSEAAYRNKTGKRKRKQNYNCFHFHNTSAQFVQNDERKRAKIEVARRHKDAYSHITGADVIQAAKDRGFRLVAPNQHDIASKKATTQVLIGHAISRIAPTLESRRLMLYLLLGLLYFSASLFEENKKRCFFFDF